MELLTNAADGAKSLIDASDRLVLYVEIARLYGTLGYQRKAAFFSRQVAQLYLQQDNRLAAISAMQVLAMTTKAYRVQSKASISEDSSGKVSILVLRKGFLVIFCFCVCLHACTHALVVFSNRIGGLLCAFEVGSRQSSMIYFSNLVPFLL